MVRFGFLPRLSLLSFSLLISPVLNASTPSSTATSLALSSASLAAGGVVTLTASVTSSGKPVSPGLVLFCDAAAAHCTDVHILGQAQLTSAGIAKVKLRQPIGSHGVRAEFQGTQLYSKSQSSSQNLTVTGQLRTSSYVWVDGPSIFGLVSTAGVVPATGTVDFLDASDGDSVFASEGMWDEVWRAPSFSTAASIPVGSGPAGDVIGDFNNDGIPDIAETDVFSGTVTILLGKGDGTFTKETIDTGGPAAMVVGDFNSDGLQDIAYTNTQTYEFVVLLGKGDGTFTKEFTVSVDAYYNQGVMGDFNHDGNADVAFGGSNGQVLVFLGKGDGTFTGRNEIPIDTYTYIGGLTAGDFNGDGFADIAVSSWDNTIRVLLSKGDGTFIVGPTIGAGAGAMAIADFNGDGILDLAIGNVFEDTAGILIGNGNGTFKSQVKMATGSHPNYIAIGDFNGDGNADVITANAYANSITTLMGWGNGTFIRGPVPATGSGPYEIAVADFNGDGVADIATTNYNVNTMGILLGGVTLTKLASVSSAAVPGSGTRKVYVSYGGDALHLESKSGTGTVP
jgi:hypothetical protein